MKSPHLISVLIILFAFGFLCFADEPNNPVNSDNNSIEARLTAIEKRLDAIEKRFARLELKRIPAPNEPDKDRLRTERISKQIADLDNTLAVDEVRIKNMSVKTYPGITYRLSKGDIPKITDDLKTIKEYAALLNHQERNYSNLLQLTEKNPEVEIDIGKIKRQYDVCKKRGVLADQNLKNIRALIEYNRDLFNIVPR
jgi:hypothetical protein